MRLGNISCSSGRVIEFVSVSFIEKQAGVSLTKWTDHSENDKAVTHRDNCTGRTFLEIEFLRVSHFFLCSSKKERKKEMVILTFNP